VWTQADSGSNVRMRTNADSQGQNPQTDADSKYRDLHISDTNTSTGICPSTLTETQQMLTKQNLQK